jgi:hypothetical protein
MVGGIQRIHDGGWDPSAQSGGSKSAQVRASEAMYGSRTLSALSALSTLATLSALATPATLATLSTLSTLATLATLAIYSLHILAAHSPTVLTTLRAHSYCTTLAIYTYTGSPLTRPDVDTVHRSGFSFEHHIIGGVHPGQEAHSGVPDSSD